MMGSRSAQRPGSGALGPSPFVILVHEHDPATSVVAVQGELDLSSAPELKWVLTDALEGGASRLVVDLSETSFMDSTGLGVLIGMNKRLAPDSKLMIVCPPGVVRQVFAFSGTDAAFSMHGTLQEATAQHEARAPRAG